MVASAAGASAPSAATETPASHALVLGSGAADVGFPWAGAGLLALLIVLALLARWHAHTRGRGAAAVWQPWLGARFAGAQGLATPTLSVQSAVRLDAQTQLHVVDWEGRRLLVATCSHSGPVVLDRGAASPNLPKVPE